MILDSMQGFAQPRRGVMSSLRDLGILHRNSIIMPSLRDCFLAGQHIVPEGDHVAQKREANLALPYKVSYLSCSIIFSYTPGATARMEIGADK